MQAAMIVESPIGQLYLLEEDGALTGLYFNAGLAGQPIPVEQTPLLLSAKTQLDAFFAGSRKTFDLPLAPNGTAFQKKVWQALREIPYGETRSYKEIAIAIGSPKAVRAVGMANNRNPISIVIPCHRVIGADGSLVGYGGGIDNKRQLLELERGNS